MHNRTALNFKPLKAVMLVVGSLVLVVFLYAGWWAIWYRLPVGPPKLIDLRTSKTSAQYCISFCGALADNPHGFPGHCYVIWSTEVPTNLEESNAQSFMPYYFRDQIPSLWRFVPGRMYGNSARGNMRNLDMLSVLVDASEFEQTQQVCQSWITHPGPFRVGMRDCVAFTNEIAVLTHLHTPNPSFTFPQDYIRALRRMNSRK